LQQPNDKTLKKQKKKKKNNENPQQANSQPQNIQGQ